MYQENLSVSKGRRFIAMLRVAVLASAAALMLPGARWNSVTAVEFAQLPAGLAAWQRHSLGIYRVCGPVSKLLYALPAHLAGVRAEYPASFDSDTQDRQEWRLGRLFQNSNKYKYVNIYFYSRIIPILVTLLGGCLVCEWSTRLFGSGPGIISLCLWCWLPLILAHGSLTTSDMASAVMLLLVTRSYSVFVLRPQAATALTTGILLGAAAATKFTLLVLYPFSLALLVCRGIQIGRRENRRRLTQLIALTLLTWVTSVFVLDLLYLCQGIGFRLVRWQPHSIAIDETLRTLGRWQATAWVLHVPLPIPSEFLLGLDFQLADTEKVRTAYLLGESRMGGWWYWYPVVTLLKVPLPVLIIFGLAIVRLRGALSDHDALGWALFCILVPAAEAALAISAATGTGTNSTYRYMIPTLGLFCVLGGLCWKVGRSRIRTATIVLLVWLATNAVSGVPDHLGWQNEASSAWRLWSRRPAVLGDSLDWGQDLMRLHGWVTRHDRSGSTLLSVYGMGEANTYGLAGPAVLPASTSWEGSRYLAISANILYGFEDHQCVTVDGFPSSISFVQRELLQNEKPCDRVGNSILIFDISKMRSNPAIP